MKNAYYFDHDYNARNDQRVLALRAELGWAGYGLFFATLEFLCESNGYLKREALAGVSLGLSQAKGEYEAFIKLCLNVGLFKEDENGIYSERINEHLAYREKLREAGSRGGRGNKRDAEATLKPPFSHPKATLEAGKERKGKESIVKEIKEKKIKKHVFSFEKVPFDFLSVVKSWLKYKEERNEAYKSQTSFDAMVSKLIRESGDTPEVAMQMIENAMAANWQGFFPLKNQPSKTTKEIFTKEEYEQMDREAGLI